MKRAFLVILAALMMFGFTLGCEPPPQEPMDDPPTEQQPQDDPYGQEGGQSGEDPFG